MAGEELINGTPTGLVPKMREYSVADSVFYQQLLITDAPVDPDNHAALDEQIDPFGPREDKAADLPAVGVMLTFEQGWFQEGLSLGELRKSLTLAPGEVTRIATVDWRRTMTSRDESSRDQTEITSAETDNASVAESVTSAVLKETTSGVSSNAGFGSHSESSVSGGLFWGGGSHSSGSNFHLGLTAAASTGTRDAATEASASISRKTSQHAQAARATRATQIREVTESESQSTNTRVIANYNHAHALTMQYFEVLQIYALKTKVVRADRCIFVPMEPVVYSEETLREWSKNKPKQLEMLRRTVRELGMTDLDELIGDFDNSPSLDQRIDAAKKQEAELAGQIRLAEAAVADAALEREARLVEHQRNLEALTLVRSRRSTRRAQIEESAFRGFLPMPWEDPGAFNPRLQQQIQQQIDSDAELAAIAVEERAASELANISDEALAKDSRAQAAAQSELDDFDRRHATTLDEIADYQTKKAERHRLFGLLEKQSLLLNQQMWMRVDPHVWHGLLANTTFPSATDLSRSQDATIDLTTAATKVVGATSMPAPRSHEYAGQPIGGLINPEPLGYFGNYMAFAWDFPKEASDAARQFEERYVEDPVGWSAKSTVEVKIALPSEGIFAEAVLGRSNSAEEIDLTRFWNWQDSPIPILPPSMSPVDTASRARDVLLPKAMEFEQAIAAIQNADEVTLTDSSKLLETLRNSIGPDMRALANAATDAGVKAGQNATQGADRSAQQTLQIGQNQMDAIVGLANSEVVKTIGSAAGGGEGLAGMIGGGGSGGGSGGLTSLGGLMNQAEGGGGDAEGGGLVDLAKQAVTAATNKGGK